MDDYCEACGENVANRECAHGILCDACDAQVHGSIGGRCEVRHSSNGWNEWHAQGHEFDIQCD